MVPVLVWWLAAAVAAWAQTPEESLALAQPFADAGLRGTFVSYDLTEGRCVAHDPARAQQRFVPASTFKIANSLIGLECGAVRNVDEVLPYGGKPQPFPTWEHDMGLREAIKLSAVPIYQELARRIGLERMTVGVKALGYGNMEVGPVVDRFWLDGPLQISACEQTQFLARLVRGQLPVSASTLAAVEEITLQEKTPGAELHYKTGWDDDVKPPIGWVVGWVQTADRAWTFALNIDATDAAYMPKRIPLAKACLAALRVWPPEPPPTK